MNHSTPPEVALLASGHSSPQSTATADASGLMAVLTQVSFASLDLEPVLQQALEAADFKYCTPVQMKALPHALAALDIEARAETGTGKTLVFLLAAMNRLLRIPAVSEGNASSSVPRALIIAPTRELAVQIHRDALLLSKHTNLRLALAFGGIDYHKQRATIAAGVDILIGTPGRLIDYLKQGVYTLKHIQVAVIDEADRLFDLGFVRSLRYLLRRMPPATQRLNMLFSATLSHRVSELAYEHMNAPISISTTSADCNVGAESIQHSLFHVATEGKLPLLLRLLEWIGPEPRVIVFFNVKFELERIDRQLRAKGHAVGTLSGNVPQVKRMARLERFRQAQLSLLLATDVAARGLHIADVSYVINYDLPQDAESYIHRTGRTGRIGAAGYAISLCCERWCYSLQEIEQLIGRRIPVIVPTDEFQQIRSIRGT